jgi:hypothetical protein
MRWLIFSMVSGSSILGCRTPKIYFRICAIFAAGQSIYFVMKQMSHSSIDVTVGVYGHQIEERNPEAAAKTDAMMRATNNQRTRSFP